MDYEHLRFEREPDTTERHRRKDRRPRFEPEDPKTSGTELLGRLGRARRILEGALAGDDPGANNWELALQGRARRKKSCARSRALLVRYGVRSTSTREGRLHA